MGDVIGINYSSVIPVIELYLEDRESVRDCFEKILYLSHFDVGKIRDDSKKATEKAQQDRPPRRR